MFGGFEGSDIPSYAIDICPDSLNNYFSGKSRKTYLFRLFEVFRALRGFDHVLPHINMDAKEHKLKYWRV